ETNDNPRRRLVGLVLLRVLIASALFGAALATNYSQTPEDAASRASLFGFLTSAYASAALEFVWILSRRNLRSLTWVHAGIEAALAAWLVALTGGVESPFAFLLLVSTVHGALAAGSAGAFTAAALSTASLVAMATGLPLPGWIAPTHTEGSRATALIL